MLGLEGQISEGRAGGLNDAAHRFDQPRMQRLTAIGQACSLNAKLQWVQVGVALADTHAGRLAGMPDRIFREIALLVGAVRHQPLLLSRNPDVEYLTQAEPARDFSDPVRPKGERRLVEEDVAGCSNGALQVLNAMMLVAMERSAEVPDAIAGIGPVRIDAGFQRRQRHHGLEGRAGWIGGGQRLVEQRLAFVLSQRCVLRPGQAANETIGVEAGAGEQAQDVAVAAVHHHRGAGLVAEHLHGAVLDVGVQRQHDLLAGDRLDVAGRVGGDLVATGVDLDLLGARLAAQGQVEGLFNALPADPKTRIQEDRIGVGAGGRQVRAVDLGHIADHVGEGPAIGVNAHLAHVGGDAAQFRRPDIDGAELFPAHVLHDLHRRLARRVGDLPQQAGLAGVVQRHELGQGLQRRFRIDTFVLGDHQPEVGAVGGQHHAIAVDDQAARRRRHLEVELVGG